jgi:hypothetical protein
MSSSKQQALHVDMEDQCPLSVEFRDMNTYVEQGRVTEDVKRQVWE